MSARKKLYEITTIEGEVVEPSISIQERAAVNLICLIILQYWMSRLNC